MAQDYYGGGGDAGPSANAPELDAPDAPEEKPPEDGKKPDESMDETALVPLSAVSEGAKVGDVCKFKIVHLYEDEAEIQYLKDDKDEAGKDDDDEHPVDRVARETGEM